MDDDESLVMISVRSNSRKTIKTAHHTHSPDPNTDTVLSPAINMSPFSTPAHSTRGDYSSFLMHTDRGGRGGESHSTTKQQQQHTTTTDDNDENVVIIVSPTLSHPARTHRAYDFSSAPLVEDGEDNENVLIRVRSMNNSASKRNLPHSSALTKPAEPTFPSLAQHGESTPSLEHPLHLVETSVEDTPPPHPPTPPGSEQQKALLQQRARARTRRMSIAPTPSAAARNVSHRSSRVPSDASHAVRFEPLPAVQNVPQTKLSLQLRTVTVAPRCPSCSDLTCTIAQTQRLSAYLPDRCTSCHERIAKDRTLFFCPFCGALLLDPASRIVRTAVGDLYQIPLKTDPDLNESSVAPEKKDPSNIVHDQDAQNRNYLSKKQKWTDMDWDFSKDDDEAHSPTLYDSEGLLAAL